MNRFNPEVIQYESLPSTNTEAARLAVEGAAEGLCVVADEQTAGRGRLQRSWLSPKGAGLYFSALLRPSMPINQWSLLTFMAALAVSDALRDACELKTDIKWPNDLLAGERKICGILAEAIETDKGRAVVVGIGINLTTEAFPRTSMRWLSPLKKQRRNVPIEKSSWRLCCARSHPGTYCCSRAGDSSRYWKPGPVVHPSQKGSA